MSVSSPITYCLASRRLFTFMLSPRALCSKPSQRAAPIGPHAQFLILHSRSMRTCGALALRSSSSRIP
eukprot:5430317-Pleurochrysis_carterae.AAC.6